MRRINLKFFLSLLLLVLVLAGSVAGVHYFQRQRIAAALLWQAGRAEEQGQIGDMARYLTRYLEFNPRDLDATARLGKALTGEHFTANPRSQRRGLYLLDLVATREPERSDIRLETVRTALALHADKMARDHLQVLWKQATQPKAAVTVKERGELEGLWGALVEAESRPDDAIDWCRKAVAHNPEEIENYNRLARLLRRNHASQPAKTAAAAREADRLIDQMVSANPESARSYLSRWRYRRDIEWLKENGVLSDARLARAAEDVAAAAKRAPQNLDVLLARAELERLRAQLVSADTSADKAERERAVLEHRDQAYQILHEGLKLLPEEGKRRDNDPVQFQFCWHLANLLLDDPRGPDAPESQEAAAEAEQIVARLAKAHSVPAAVDYLRARLSLRSRHWSDAAALLEQARPLLDKPDLVAQVDLYLGQCYEQLDEPGQMYAAFSRLAAFDPQSTAARLGMATAQWAMGRLDEAAGQYRQMMMQGAAPARVWLDMVRLEIRRQSQHEPKDWKEAEAALDQAEKALPDSLEPMLLRAEILSAKGQLEQAEQLLTRAQKRHPDKVEVWTGLALLAEKRKDQARGFAVLDQAEKKLGDTVELRLARAHLWGAQGKGMTDKICALARGAERFKPEDRARLLGGLAEALFWAGEFAAGRKLVHELAELPLRQNDSRLRMFLFELAQREGDEAAMTEALADLARIEGGEGAMSHYGQAERLITRVRQEKGERKSALEEARMHLDRAASLRPSWPPVALARADVADLSGNPEQAISYLKQAIDQGESNPRVIQRLVESLYRRQRYAEADQELGRLRQSLLMNSELGRLAAGIALSKGDQTRALELARDAVSEDSKDYHEQIWLGQMLAAVRAPSEAEQKLRRAVALAPKEPEPWVALVQFLAVHQEKQARQAIAQAESQIAADRATLALAQCYEAVGDTSAASRHYAEALEKKSNDIAIVRTVAAYHLRAGRIQEGARLLERIVAGKMKTSAADMDWARRSLAIVLAAGTDYQRFRRALELVNLKLDRNGQLVRDKAHEGDVSTEAERAQARVLATQGQRQFRERAIELLEALSHRQALTADDRFVLALLYEADGATAKAHERLRDLVLTQVQSPFYLAQFVLTLIRQRDFEQAASWIERLEKLERQQRKPVNTYGTVELRARLLEEQGQGEQAVTLLQTHANRAGAAADEQLLVIGSMGRQKRFAEGLALCAKAWKRCTPEGVGAASVALLRVMPHPTDEQCRQVESFLRQAIETASRPGQPPRPVLLMHVADLCDQRGRYAEAEDYYRQVLKIEPSNYVALNNLAWLVVQRTGKGAEALPMIETAVNGIGRRADLLDTRGLVYLALGKVDEAVSDLKESSTDVPTPTRLFHLARALNLSHDRDGAVKILRRAKELGLQPSALHPIEQQSCRKLLVELNMP